MKVATLHEEMSRKMEGLSQVGGLQNQIRMLESSLEQSKAEAEGIQAKCTNTVSAGESPGALNLLFFGHTAVSLWIFLLNDIETALSMFEPCITTGY